MEDLDGIPYLAAIQKLDRSAPLSPAEEEVAIVFGAGTSTGGGPV